MEIWHKFGKWEKPRNTKIRKPGMGTFGGAELVDFVIQVRQCQNCGAFESRVICEGTVELMGWLTPHTPDVAKAAAQKGVLHKNRSGKRAGVA